MTSSKACIECCKLYFECSNILRLSGNIFDITSAFGNYRIEQQMLLAFFSFPYWITRRWFTSVNLQQYFRKTTELCGIAVIMSYYIHHFLTLIFIFNQSLIVTVSPLCYHKIIRRRWVVIYSRMHSASIQYNYINKLYNQEWKSLIYSQVHTPLT